MVDEPQERQKVDLLFLHPVYDAIGYQGLMRTVELIMLDSSGHILPDLVPRGDRQVRQDLVQIVPEHVMALLDLAERLRMRNRSQDVLGVEFLAESVEVAYPALDRVELCAVIGQELFWHTKVRKTILEQVDDLAHIGARHHSGPDDEPGMVIDNL